MWLRQNGLFHGKIERNWHQSYRSTTLSLALLDYVQCDTIANNVVIYLIIAIESCITVASLEITLECNFHSSLEFIFRIENKLHANTIKCITKSTEAHHGRPNFSATIKLICDSAASCCSDSCGHYNRHGICWTLCDEHFMSPPLSSTCIIRSKSHWSILVFLVGLYICTVAMRSNFLVMSRAHGSPIALDREKHPYNQYYIIWIIPAKKCSFCCGAS